jgi:hypothetical protein
MLEEGEEKVGEEGEGADEHGRRHSPRRELSILQDCHTRLYQIEQGVVNYLNASAVSRA